MQSKFPPFEIDDAEVLSREPAAVFLEADIEGTTYRMAFRRPGRAHMSLAVQRNGKPMNDMGNLVNACLVSPTPAEAAAFLAFYPGACFTYGNKLLEIAGLTEATRSENP